MRIEKIARGVESGQAETRSIQALCPAVVSAHLLLFKICSIFIFNFTYCDDYFYSKLCLNYGRVYYFIIKNYQTNTEYPKTLIIIIEIKFVIVEHNLVWTSCLTELNNLLCR